MPSFKETFLRIYRRGQGDPSNGGTVTLGLPTRLKTVAVINQKGGCGKTTTAVNLAACLAEAGARVLLIDVDPQAHATLGLGLRGDEIDKTLYHAMQLGGLPMTQVILPTYHPNLKLVPSNSLLASLQVELVERLGRERILSDCLAQVEGNFHFILMDCPPSLNLLTLNALTAATHVLVPLQTHYLSLDGMRELFKTVELVQANFNPHLEILGILPTLFDHRTRMNRAMLQTIREYFKGKVFETVIHLSTSLTESPMMGQPVVRFAPQSRGARDYQALAEELLRANG